MAQTETLAGTTTTSGYTYDLAGCLPAVTRNGVTAATYIYDANGNHLSHNGTAGIYDAQDRLLQYGTTTSTYIAGLSIYRSGISPLDPCLTLNASLNCQCHPPHPRATFMHVDFFSSLLCAWHVEPARASQGTWVNQDIEHPFDHRFGVWAVALDAIWISQGQDRQAMGGMPLAHSRFQRCGACRVSVAGDHEDVVVLTGLPNRRVRGVLRQVELLERTEHTRTVT
jgi:hypothetical protein